MLYIFLIVAVYLHMCSNEKHLDQMGQTYHTGRNEENKWVVKENVIYLRMIRKILQWNIEMNAMKLAENINM